MNQDNETNEEIGVDDSEDTRESTISFDIEEDDLNHQHEVLHLGQAHQVKSLRTPGVLLPKKGSRGNTAIVRPLFPKS
jgi:hypothetical protein